jgi:hypothetical protein
MHPRKPDTTRFGICERLGALHCQKTVSDSAKELGIGATMFLLTTKSLAILFGVLTFLNIPVMAFYY